MNSSFKEGLLGLKKGGSPQHVFIFPPTSYPLPCITSMPVLVPLFLPLSICVTTLLFIFALSLSLSSFSFFSVSPYLSLCPALRIHNHTVLPSSHNSSYVYSNDSAYTNISATVGEDYVCSLNAHLFLHCILSPATTGLCLPHVTGKSPKVV